MESSEHSKSTSGSAAEPSKVEDATVRHDVSYYRQSAAAKRITMQALAQARKARVEAFALVALAAVVIGLYLFREEIFGTDVPVRIAAAILLAAIGWRFARAIGRAMGPRLLSRFDPGTASTVSFFARLLTLLVVALIAFRLVDVQPQALALGGAVTAVIIGLAAQSTLGNLIAGAVLLIARPFQIDERVRIQSGALGGQLEGTAVSVGLLYTTLARGDATILIPNSSVMAATVMPIRQPAGVDLRATLRSGLKPSELQRLLDEGVNTPTRDRPHIALERVDGQGTVVRITASPVAATDGDRLADEVLAVVSSVTPDAG